MDSITYQIGDNLYINLTNRCLNQCEFCIRYKARNLNQKYPLWLDREPTVDEVIKKIGDPSPYPQIAFVGYGEPLIRLEEVIAIAKELKTKYQGKIRIDTNGLANLFWGRNILPELKGLIDIISISLNAENAELYDRICCSYYGLAAFPAVLEFIKEAKNNVPQVEVTVVDLPIVDKEKCRQIATDLGAAFRVRPYYEETYIR